MMRSLCAVLLFAALGASASAQWVEPEAQTLWQKTGPQSADIFGWLVAVLDDVDGDGLKDFATCAPFFDRGGRSSAGRVSVHSGADGSAIWDLAGNARSQILGYALESIEDVSGDGLRDVVVGGPFGGNGGEVLVLSGVDGTLLHSFTGSPNGSAGYGVATDGDFDGDGQDDIAIGDAGDDTLGTNVGRAFVLSGADFSLITTIDSPVVGRSRFGAAIAFLNDLDGDGRDELAVGERLVGDDPEGEIHVFSYDGVQPQHVYSIDNVGMSCALCGDLLFSGADVDGDGVFDLALGDLDKDCVSLFSGFDGTLIREHFGDAPDSIGTGGAFIPDRNGDGVPELLVGARDNDAGANQGGKIFIFSGVDGTLLRTWTGNLAERRVGADVEPLDDIDGDGTIDFVAGAPNASTGGIGRVMVISGKECPASASNYGNGFPGTLGVPGLVSSGPPLLGTSVTIHADNSLGANTSGALFMGFSPTQIPGAWGGELLVVPSFVFPVSIPVSGLDLPATFPADGDLCGLEIDLQVLQSDSGALHGISATTGLALFLGV